MTCHATVVKLAGVGLVADVYFVMTSVDGEFLPTDGVCPREVRDGGEETVMALRKVIEPERFRGESLRVIRGVG